MAFIEIFLIKKVIFNWYYTTVSFLCLNLRGVPEKKLLLILTLYQVKKKDILGTTHD